MSNENDALRIAVLKWIKENYIVISLLILLFGVVLDYFFAIDGKRKWVDILSGLCYNLSISLFVLVSLEIGLEQIFKKEDEVQQGLIRQNHQKQIEQLYNDTRENVFKGVFNRLIPDELVSIFSKDIIQQDVVRKKARWEYLIEERKDKVGYALRQTIEYELHNITGSDIEEVISISSETNSINSTKFTYFKTELNGDKVEEFSEKDIAGSAVKNANGETSVYKVKIKAGEHLKIIHRIMTTYNSFNIIDVHFANRSIVGLDIHFEKPKDCKLTIIPSFSETPCFTSIDNTSFRTTKTLLGILKGQCISFIIEKQPGIDQENSRDILGVSSTASEPAC